MRRNIEIKARAREFPRQRLLAAELVGGRPEILHQVDTFFLTGQGRLKLRQIAGGPSELIFYRRDDTSGPKSCRYLLMSTDHPVALRGLLAAAFGLRGEVRKTRTVYRAAGTRIHLDEVEGLGGFLELEYVVGPDATAAAAEETVRRLMRRLDIHEEDLIGNAYIDMLEQRGYNPPSTEPFLDSH
jgi:adenylate cyclase class IV